jgi:glycosyltransferase 2 family protein
MLAKSRRVILLLISLLVLAFLLYKFRNSISLEGFHWGTVAKSIREASLSMLALAIVTIYACYAIRAARWVRFCRWLGTARFSNVFSATLMGFSCTFLLGRAGEPIRPVLIARKDKLPVSQMFGIYVLERVADMAATALLAVFALLSFERRQIGGSANELVMKVARSAGLILLIGLAVAIAFLVYFRYHGGAWLARKLQHESWRHGWREKLAALLEGFSEGLRGIRTVGDLLALFVYTIAHWVLVLLAYVLVLRAFGGDLAAIGFTGVALVCAFTLVGSAAQLPGVGGGSQLATFLVLTLIFGVEKEPAATASITIWLITFAACCLAGLPLLFHQGWSMGELRRIAATEEQAGEADLIAHAEHPADQGETHS